MDRRRFGKLASLTALAALADVAEASAAQAGRAPEVVLQDSGILIAFDSQTGAITRMVHTPTQWTIERRPELGVSFRLLAPLPDQRANFILGSRQRAAKVEKTSDSQVRIQWQNLMSEDGEILPITFTATATLSNGALTFDATLDNKSSRTIETADYPCFGDFNPPSPDESLKAQHMWTGALQAEEIYPHFANDLGYWGVRYPTKTFNSYQSQFCLIQAPRQGIYVAMHDPAIRYLLQFTFEQRPGTVDWNQNAVPAGSEIGGFPVHLEFRTCHFIYAHPGSTVHFAPVVLHPYTDDWHTGLDIYRDWRKTWFAAPMIPSWVREVHSWQQIQLNGAEEDDTIHYRGLDAYGTECAGNGVTAIQVVGWNRGGQDGGDPSLDTNPRLGTWQDLHDAIARIQAKGVKVILFGKPHLADMSTDWYKEVLYKYDALDPYGNKYESNCCSYTTPTQLAGINPRRRTSMDVCSQDYRNIATHEFEKILALGASGWLFDEVLEHEGVVYNFSADHGYDPPGYLYGCDIPLAKQFRAAADKVNRDFLFAGEGPGDWLMPWYVLGYYRIGWGTVPALRYIDPHAPMMAAVRGFNARDQLNLILAFRYIISYEPYNFKGHLTDFPLTLAYGKKIDNLRRRYRTYLWDGVFQDTLGAEVSADGAHRYTVFIANGGKRAVVVINQESEKEIRAKVNLSNPGSLAIVTPEQPDLQPSTGTLQIPARSVAVLIEQ